MSKIPDVLLIEPRVFHDERGFFEETYEKNRYVDAGIVEEFVQDNFSRSKKGTLRGLHYQIEHPQGKLVQVLRGCVFDVAVDLRKSSPTFGKWCGYDLSDENHCQLYIPPGFAHGFYVLSETADLFYKCTDFYFPEHERTLIYNDAQTGIDWPIDVSPIVTEKDLAGLPFDQIECFASY